MALKEIKVVIPNEEAVAIEYPGFVRNTERALATLGGINDIAAAVSSKQQYLKLKHRPEDRTSHPLYGERLEHTRLLLRIARPKQQPSGGNSASAQTADGAATESTPDAVDAMDTGPPSQPPESAQGEASAPTDRDSGAAAAPALSSQDGVTASVVARVTPTFRFPGLADYAFLAHDPLLSTRARDTLPYDQRPERAEPTKAAQPFLLIPQLFSWLDLPQDYAFKQLQSKQSVRAAGRTDPNWGDAPVISFYAEGVPPPVAATAAAAPGAAAADGTGAAAAAAASTTAPAGVSDVRAYRVLEAEVTRLLAQRPVWGLDLIRERCAACPAVVAAMPNGCDAAAVERVVQRLCYRFKTGPWRGLFIRRGYDPRAEVEARKYQAVVYVLPNNWYRSMLKVGVRQVQQQLQQQRKAAAAAAAGGGKGEGGAEKKRSAASSASAPDGTTGTAAGTAGGLPKSPASFALAPTSLDDLHNFRSLPTQQSTTFQLVDMQLKEVQDVLQEVPSGPEANRCSEKTGWFNNATMQAMQNAIQQRILQLMDQLAPPGALTSSNAGGAGGAAAASAGAAAVPAHGKATDGAAPAAPTGTSADGTAPGDTGRSGAAAAAADCDTEMADADAEGRRAAAGPAAGTAEKGADEALRALMAQMNLRGLTGPSGVGGGGGGGTGSGAAGGGAGGAHGNGGGGGMDDADVLAGLFGSDDDDDDFRLLDEHDDGGEGAGGGASGAGRLGRGHRDEEEEDADGSGGASEEEEEEDEEEDGEEDDEEEEGGGKSGEEKHWARRSRRSRRGRGGPAGAEGVTAAAAAAGPAGTAGTAAAANAGNGLAGPGHGGLGGEGSEGEESVMESEYDVGMTGDEEDDDDEDDVGGGGGGGGLYGDGAFGRVVVPYDGGVPARFGSGGTGGMFGSEDEDEPY